MSICSYLADPQIQVSVKAVRPELKEKLHLNFSKVEEYRKKELLGENNWYFVKLIIPEYFFKPFLWLFVRTLLCFLGTFGRLDYLLEKGGSDHTVRTEWMSILPTHRRQGSIDSSKLNISMCYYLNKFSRRDKYLGETFSFWKWRLEPYSDIIQWITILARIIHPTMVFLRGPRSMPPKGINCSLLESRWCLHPLTFVFFASLSPVSLMQG